MASDCLFCRIVSGELPSEQIYSNEELYAFRDINPAAPVHILIIPRQHISRMEDAGPDDSGLMGRLLVKAGEIARQQGLSAAGYRCVINSGDRGGQTVHHLHLHILGGRQMTWPPG